MRDPRDNQGDRPMNEEPGRAEHRVEEERYVVDEPTSNRPADQDLNRPLSRDVNRPLSRDTNPNLDRDRVDYMGTRYGSAGPYSNLALTDMVRWGPIIAGFAATAKGCSYFPFSGTTLSTLAPDVAGDSRTKSALHFTPERPLPVALVRKLLRARLAEVGTRAKRP